MNALQGVPPVLANYSTLQELYVVTSRTNELRMREHSPHLVCSCLSVCLWASRNLGKNDLTSLGAFPSNLSTLCDALSHNEVTAAACTRS